MPPLSMLTPHGTTTSGEEARSMGPTINSSPHSMAEAMCSETQSGVLQSGLVLE